MPLWDTYNGDLTEDIVHSGDTPFNVKQRALSHIQQLLPKQQSEYNLPDPLPQHQHFQIQNTINSIEAFENTEQMRNTFIEKPLRDTFIYIFVVSSYINQGRHLMYIVS